MDGSNSREVLVHVTAVDGLPVAEGYKRPPGSIVLAVNLQTGGVISLAGGGHDKTDAEIDSFIKAVKQVDPYFVVVMFDGPSHLIITCDLTSEAHPNLFEALVDCFTRLRPCAETLSAWRGDPNEYFAICRQFEAAGLKKPAIVAWSGGEETRRELNVASLYHVPIGIVAGSGPLCDEIVAAIRDEDEDRKFGITRDRAWAIKDPTPESLGRFLKSWMVVYEEVHDYP